MAGNLTPYTEVDAITYGFQGRQVDEETGLVYLRHRYYDPRMGRFLQRDPMGYVDGFNLYEFAGGSPVNWGDPLGLQRDNAMCLLQQNPQPLGNPRPFGTPRPLGGGQINQMLNIMMGFPLMGMPALLGMPTLNGMPEFGGIGMGIAAILSNLLNPKLGNGLWSSFFQGVKSSVIGGLLITGVAIGAATLGVPIAFITGTLLVAGKIGLALTAASIVFDLYTGNSEHLAFTLGTLIGGFGVHLVPIPRGGTWEPLGRTLASKLSPLGKHQPDKGYEGFNPKNEWKKRWIFKGNRLNPKDRWKNLVTAAGTGPSPFGGSLAVPGIINLFTGIYLYEYLFKND